MRQETRDTIRKIDDNTLFVRESDYPKGGAYKVAESLVRKINKEYKEDIAVREQHSDGHSVTINPSAKLVDKYYDHYVETFYATQEPSGIDRFGDSVPNGNPNLTTGSAGNGAATTAFSTPLFDALSPVAGSTVSFQGKPGHTLTSVTADPHIENPAPMDPKIEKDVDEKFAKLQQVGSEVKLIQKLKDGKLTSTYETKDGHIVKNKTNDESVGIQTEVGRRLAMQLHDHMEHIMDRLVDKNGRMRDTIEPLEEGKDGKFPAVYSMMESALKQRVESYPINTRFIYNKPVYNQTYDKASRVDFLALKPNGKADIFSFDVIGEGNWKPIHQEGPRDVRPKDQELMLDYLNQTKGILKNAYGIKQFDKSEVVPMYIAVNKISITAANWDGFNSASNNRKSIDPVPTWDQSSGNEQTDKLIQSLIDVYKSKDNQKYSDENSEAMKGIRRTIRAVQNQKGIPPLINLIEMSAKSSDIIVSNFIRDVRTKPVADFTEADFAAESSKLNKLSDQLRTFSDMYLRYKDFYDNPSPSEKKLFDNLKNASVHALEALHRLDEVKREFVQDKLATKYGIENLLLPEKTVGWYEGNAQPFTEATTKAHYVFTRMMENTRNQYQNRTREHLNELNTVYEGVQGWLKGRSNKDLLDAIKQKDEKGHYANRLVREYKKEFYTTLGDKQKEKNAENLKWIKENIDTEAVKKWAIEEKTKAYKYSRDNIQDPYFQAQYEEKKGTEYDINGSEIYFKPEIRKFPKKETWRSDEYKNLVDKPENAPVLALYNYAQKINRIATSSGYLEYDRMTTFLPFLHKSLADKVVFGGKYSFMDSIVNSLTVGRTDIDFGKYDRLANDQVDSLVKYFTNDFGKEVVGTDGKTYIDHSNVSDDIVKNLALYTAKVMEYDGKSKIEESTKLLLWAEKNKESLQANIFGNLIEGADPKRDNDQNYQLLKDFVQNQLYDQSYVKSRYTDIASRKAINDTWNNIREKMNKRLGFEIMPELNGQRHFSFMKTLEAMKTIQQIKVLGINVGASTYRFLSTNIQGLIGAGEYYSTKDYFAHELRHTQLQFYKGNAELHIALLKHFWPVDGQMQHEMNALSLSHLTNQSASDFLMGMIKRAHDYVQYVNFGAMLDNTIIIDGKIHNAYKYQRMLDGQARYDLTKSKSERDEIASNLENRVKELVEQHGLINKASMVDGKLKIDGLDMDNATVAQFKGLVRTIGRKVSGNISTENESRLRMTVLGRQLSMFHNWIFGMIDTRFVDLKHSESIQEYKWGRIRMMGKLIVENGLSSISDMTSMYRVTDKGIGLMEKLYEQKKADFEKERGGKFDMTKEQFYDLVRKNIAQQTKEIACMMLLASALAGLIAVAHDADKDKKGYYAFTERVLERSYEEINLYYNPISMQNIVNGSLFPTLGLLTDAARFSGSFADYGLGKLLNDEEKVKNAHPAKYAMKMLPVSAQFPSYISVLMPDLAKELGIQVGNKKLAK
jgi:hypothetical protein